MGYDGGILKVFRRYDDDRSGSITANEMIMMVRIVGQRDDVMVRIVGYVQHTPGVNIPTSAKSQLEGICRTLLHMKRFLYGGTECVS